jgi:hypothetical protein
MAQKPAGFLNMTRLRARGWTPAMIRDLLGQPDRLARNRRFPGAAPVRLYSMARIESMESKAVFRRASALAEARSAAARAGAQHRRERMLRLMNADEISVPRLRDSVLTARAVRHRDEREGETTNPADVDRRTMDRWKVNYLRHQLTTYDTLLDELFGQAGRPEAERTLRRRVYSAICNTYPDLAAECQRQLRARERP